MKIVIYGNGAMAKTIFSYLRSGGEDVSGFTVDDHCIEGKEVSMYSLPVVPFSEVDERFSPVSHKMIVAVGFAEMNALRERKHYEIKQKGYGFMSFVHSSVIRHEGVTIEENCIILDHVSIHPGSIIKKGSYISSNVNIGHDCVIGEFNWINSGVAIAGNCQVGRSCFFGVNASSGHELKLGERNFIAANTLVNSSTQDDEVYLSEPGQCFRLKSRAFLKFSRSLKASE